MPDDEVLNSDGQVDPPLTATDNGPKPGDEEPDMADVEVPEDADA